LLGGGGAAAFWVMRRPAGAPAEAKNPAAHANDGIVSFEPFVANLADTGSARYLRVSIRLIVPSVEDAERIQKSEVMLMRVRSATLELLADQTAERVVTAEGKAALKQAIAARANAVIEPTKISD